MSILVSILHDPGADDYVYRLVYVDNHLPVGKGGPSVAFTGPQARAYSGIMAQYYRDVEWLRVGELIYAVDYSNE